jgi:hypothetical protein
MSMLGNNTPTPAQSRAIEQLKGLINIGNTGGRTLCCLVGSQGSGKTWLAKRIADASVFGSTRYIAVNNIILKIIDEDPLLKEIFEFSPDSLNSDLKRFGSRVRQVVHDKVAQQFLPGGLTVLDHLELVFALGMDPVTTWYNDAVGNKRILMVLTGRMDGQMCRCGEHTLTRGDQPIVELEV